MAEEKVEAREFNIRQVLPWTELFRSFQVALDLKKLLLAAAGILVMSFGWWLLAVIFFGSQAKPQLEDPKYSVNNYSPKEGPEDAATLERKRAENAWKQFKEDRHKWNVLHAAAGSTPDYTDAGDLAERMDDYKAVKAALDEGKKEFEIGGKSYRVREKPYGKLSTWPFEEDRGPNPYLMVTGQTGRPWESGHFGEWVLSKQIPVLIEPLEKFLYPVVNLLLPSTGPLNRLYFLLVTVWTLVTWALFGGAITRMASVQIARNDKIGMTEALRFVTSRYVSFLSAPLFPLLFIAFVVFLLAIYALFFMIPVLGDIVIAGIGYPLVILAGLVMAVVLVGLVGWPMMYATISAEGSDSFDAISRSYSYVYQSPWHYIWYSLVAVGYGVVVVFFVGFMGSLIVYLGKWGVSQAVVAERDPSFLFVYAPDFISLADVAARGGDGGRQPDRQGRPDRRGALAKYKGTFRWWNYAGAGMVTGWLYLFFLLILGFGYSYFWSASTIIYLLMRRKVDDTDMDEVYLEEDEAEESYTRQHDAGGPIPCAEPGTGRRVAANGRGARRCAMRRLRRLRPVRSQPRHLPKSPGPRPVTATRRRPMAPIPKRANQGAGHPGFSGPDNSCPAGLDCPAH